MQGIPPKWVFHIEKDFMVENFRLCLAGDQEIG